MKNTLFDREFFLKNRARAVHSILQHSSLKKDLAQDLIERLDLLNIPQPTRILELGATCTSFLAHPLKKILKPKVYIVSDSSFSMLAKHTESAKLCLFEEELPFKQECFQAVVSSGFFHWVEDWRKMLSEVHRVLSPRSVFLANFFGGQTLPELQFSFMQAERKMSPHISLFCQLQDITHLLKEASFSSIIVDSAKCVHFFADALTLMHELKAMGESNCLTSRHKGLFSPRIMRAVVEAYHEHFKQEKGIPATFEIYTITAYK